ncbi:TIGR03083 family protein [Amycolatopsis arida]|uniref:TIGR03083 family protein n=1 Tax=Amycolatopsis arida TaxID=587909 RepID=A0A1I5XRB4_9PSEU|nr:maleylpyruvate isomerase family mycothiol-dependent enzyme [Amycolatopsis arida]TDX97305.1 uncharacterized protein (TIGR03083 family) [Amycolatopsis arida]SFQ34515.1 TIGR03083 family protein [Amycolatopsis arida]
MAGQAMVDPGRLLEVFGTEGERLAATAHVTPPDVPVPRCPGWTSGELVRHVGSVYRVVLGWLAEGRRPREWQHAPRPGQSAEEYLREGLAALRTELGRHDPDERADTWWPADRTYGFWRRRMAHETTIHRIDLQYAAGAEPDAVAEDVALDGVDEALALWFGQRLPMLGLTGTRPGAVAVRTGGHTWLTRAGPTETTAWRCSAAEARRADAVVSGTPQQIYRWLWGRAGPWSITVERGDHDAVGQLWALLRLATR